jgi:DNA polymerase-1
LIRNLLIDADILAYVATAANERRYLWPGQEQASVAADFEAAKQAADDELNRLADLLKADEVTVCLSDDFANFRKLLVDPSYKQARPGRSERPQHLYDLKDWLRQEWPCLELPMLEADDVMGINAVRRYGADPIVVSADKDLMGVPCLLFRPHKHTDETPPTILDISELDAMRFHLWQVLVGDPTDGYGGCPGIGEKSEYAEAVLEAEDEVEAWDTVLAAYESKGLTEEDAVRQARLAYILRDGDYVDQRVRLWCPPAWEDDDD